MGYFFTLLSGCVGASLTLLIVLLADVLRRRHDDKRERLHYLCEIRSRILMADRFVETELRTRIHCAGSESDIRSFSLLVNQIDALFVDKYFFLKKDEVEVVEKIKQLMFLYEQRAFQCTALAAQVKSMERGPSNCMLSPYFVKKLDSSVAQCCAYRREWMDLLPKLAAGKK